MRRKSRPKVPWSNCKSGGETRGEPGVFWGDGEWEGGKTKAGGTRSRPTAKSHKSQIPDPEILTHPDWSTRRSPTANGRQGEARARDQTARFPLLEVEELLQRRENGRREPGDAKAEGQRLPGRTASREVRSDPGNVRAEMRSLRSPRPGQSRAGLLTRRGTHTQRGRTHSPPRW